jgi:hypothetical protein
MYLGLDTVENTALHSLSYILLESLSSVSEGSGQAASKHSAQPQHRLAGSQHPLIRLFLRHVAIFESYWI